MAQQAQSVAGECVSILRLSDNVIEILGLRDVFTGEPGTIISAATVSARILEDEDPNDPIAGIPDPITMAAEGGGNPDGNYRGTVPDSADFEVSDRFRAVITAVDSGNTLTIVLQGIVVE